MHYLLPEVVFRKSGETKIKLYSFVELIIITPAGVAMLVASAVVSLTVCRPMLDKRPCSRRKMACHQHKVK